MWKPGQLVTINHKVYRVTKVKTETAKSIPPALICMCCDITRGIDFCSENCGKMAFIYKDGKRQILLQSKACLQRKVTDFCYLKLI